MAHAPLAGRNLSVLVVEDHEMMRRLITDMLFLLGVEDVHEAAEGQQALDMVAARPFDAIVTDLTMAPVDGLAFLGALRHARFGERATCPVVMVTGHANPKAVMAARALGCAQFLAKPVTREDLGKRLRRAVDAPVRFVLEGEMYRPVLSAAPADDGGVWMVG
ncbi:MAG: response regulator [Alphaproteobacteria bacterium]|nr:response regulator [Alphaproteobacteria bacterium]MDX5368195.1 response regulator [Alphaproteobacteria bacterium]MDX5463011.1 response regulator [Alphaproteobacteria bacterium]